MTSLSVNLTARENITNHAELLAYVKKVIDRDDLDDCIDDWISLCEKRLNRLLRVPEMAGTATVAVTSEYSPLPDDFLEMRAVYMGDRTLPVMSLHGQIEQFRRETGDPASVSIEGTRLRFAPVGSAEVTYTYYQRIPPLSSNNPVNWLVQKYADIYVYGTLLHAESVIDDPRLIQQWKGAWDEAIAELRQSGDKARWSGPFSPTLYVQTRGARC